MLSLKRLYEIALHVMDEQDGAVGINIPLSNVRRKIERGGHLIRGNGWYAGHESLLDNQQLGVRSAQLQTFRRYGAHGRHSMRLRQIIMSCSDKMCQLTKFNEG